MVTFDHSYGSRITEGVSQILKRVGIGIILWGICLRCRLCMVFRQGEAIPFHQWDEATSAAQRVQEKYLRVPGQVIPYQISGSYSFSTRVLICCIFKYIILPFSKSDYGINFQHSVPFTGCRWEFPLIFPQRPSCSHPVPWVDSWLMWVSRFCLSALWCHLTTIGQLCYPYNYRVPLISQILEICTGGTPCVCHGDSHHDMQHSSGYADSTHLSNGTLLPSGWWVIQFQNPFLGTCFLGPLKILAVFWGVALEVELKSRVQRQVFIWEMMLRTMRKQVGK